MSVIQTLMYRRGRVQVLKEELYLYGLPVITLLNP